MWNKRGQGMSTNTIILLILGIVVLVVLILGFTKGFDKIAPFLSGSNVDNIKTSCDAACSTNAKYDYCSSERELKSDDGKLKQVTCNYLSKKQTKYGISSCGTISCDVVLVEATSVDDLQNFCLGNEDKVIQALIGDTVESYDCKVTV